MWVLLYFLLTKKNASPKDEHRSAEIPPLLLGLALGAALPCSIFLMSPAGRDRPVPASVPPGEKQEKNMTRGGRSPWGAPRRLFKAQRSSSFPHTAHPLPPICSPHSAWSTVPHYIHIWWLELDGSITFQVPSKAIL